MDDERGNRLLSQIEAFESKVSVSEKSFSGAKLKEFLTILKRKSSVKNIESIASLRMIVRTTTDVLNSEQGSSDYNDNKMLVYFKWFLEFHSYLKSLKESFDGRVHKHLLSYFYDSPYSAPSPTKSLYIDPNSSGSSSYNISLDRLDTPTSVTSSDRFTTIHPALRDTYKEYKELSDTVDEAKINRVAERLLTTGKYLEALLNEQTPIKQLITSSKIPLPVNQSDDGEEIHIV